MERVRETMLTAYRSGDPPQRDTLSLRLAAGELDAVGEAYDLHAAALRGFARRLVRDAALAEDLVHDVFVALPSAMRRFRHASSLRTFLMSIAVNHARHYVRAASRKRAALSRLGDEVAREGPTLPEEAIRQKRLVSALGRALDRLPPDQRVVFVLSALEERRSAEVAEIVGAPEATVRTRLFHARKKLRELLSAEFA